MSVTNPPLSLIVKLGSIARHAQELLTPDRHSFDAEAMDALLGDPEVVDWMAEADDLALLPVLRS